jgi:hypothetical protein
MAVFIGAATISVCARVGPVKPDWPTLFNRFCERSKNPLISPPLLSGHRLPDIRRPLSRNNYHVLEHTGGLEMATSAVIEPPTIPAMPPIQDAPPITPTCRPESRWDASWGKQATTDVDEAEEGDDKLAERKIPERRANLGYCILLSAVEDYRRAIGKDFESAQLFLYPDREAYRAQLRWAIGLAGLSEYHTRKTLDHLRKRWDAERKKEEEFMRQANLVKVTAVGRIHSAIVVSGQLQEDARERIVRYEGLTDPASKAAREEAIEDLERATATEANLGGQLDRALATQAALRAQLQGAEEV